MSALTRPAQLANKLADPSRRPDANRVRHANSVDSELVHRFVDPEEIVVLAPQAVLGAETHLDSGVLEERQHFLRRSNDVVDGASMAELAQLRRGTDDDIHAVHPGFDRDLGVVQMTARVGQDLSLQTQAGDGGAIGAALGRGEGRGQLEVLHPKGVEERRDADLLFGREEGAGELLPLAEGGFDDREVVERHGGGLSEALLAPVFLDLGGECDGQGVQTQELQLRTAFGAGEDLALHHVCGNGYGGFAFRALSVLDLGCGHVASFEACLGWGKKRNRPPGDPSGRFLVLASAESLERGRAGVVAPFLALQGFSLAEAHVSDGFHIGQSSTVQALEPRFLISQTWRPGPSRTSSRPRA